MSRGAHKVRQSDVTKVVKAMAKSGVPGWRIEIADGKIIIRGGDDREDPDVKADREWD
jgi:hypothetical protein